MPYIAELQIKVDSSQVESATQKLKEFTQATTSSAQAEATSRKVKEDSANKTVAAVTKTTAAEAKAQKAEESRYEKWFANAARRDREEAAQQQRQFTAMARESKERAANSARREREALQLEQSDARRYNSWLKQADQQAKAEAKQASSSQDTLAAQKKAAADRATSQKNEAKIQKDAADEQQRIDKIRYQSTLRRFSEEEKAAATAVKASAKASSSIDQEAKSLNNLLGAIDPVTREMKRLDELETSLKANFAKGKLNTAEYTKYQKVIDETRESVNKYNTALNRTGITAKQVRLAQQNLPAQFTDIIVSLQGGQAPLTVLLQQGGQIKDMFGGVGNALKGVAGAILPMINPVTLFGAAVAALGVAYYQGTKETDAFRLSLVSTGNAAGTTVAAMAGMAKQVDNVVGTSSKAAEVLAQLASTSKVSAGSFVELTTAAVKWEKASGQAASETVKQFSALGDDPLTAAKKLNEETGFLTASIYQQAAALVKQGRESEAAALLQNQYADTLIRRSDEIITKQGYVERAWGGIKTAAAEAWDAMLDVGRANTLEDDLDDIVKTINRKTAGINLFGGGIGAGLPSAAASGDAWTNRLQQEVDDMQKAREQMFQGEAVKKATEDFDNFQKGLITNADKADQLAAALKAVDRQVKSMRRAGFTISDADVEKAKQQAREKFKDRSGPKSATLDDTEVNDLQNKVSEIKAQYSALGEAIKAQQEAGTLSVEAGFTKRQQLLNEEAAKTKALYQEQITALEALKGAKNLSANQSISLDRKIADARSKMVVAEAEAQKNLDKATADEEKRLKRKQHNVDAYNDSLQQMLLNLKVAGARDIAGISMASGQRGVNDQLNSEDDRYANEVRDLRNQAAENPQLVDEVEQKLASAATAHTAMKNQIVQNYGDMNAAERDWQAGLTSAFKQYIEDGQKFATITNQAFTNVFTSMEDAIVGFVSTGKMSFSDLTRSILADLARIAVKAAASSALSAIIGGIGAAGTASAGSTAAGYSSAFLSGWAGVQQAKGGGWEGGKQFFAKGGAFTNSVVSKPTNFNIGEMGEKGPEAIMPLTRASDGSLGVRASVDTAGLAGAAGNSVQVIVNVDGQGNSTTSASDAGFSSFGQDIGQFVDQRYRTLMSKDLQPGGDIWKTMNG